MHKSYPPAGAAAMPRLFPCLLNLMLVMIVCFCCVIVDVVVIGFAVAVVVVCCIPTLNSCLPVHSPMFIASCKSQSFEKEVMFPLIPS
ncbi:hypothetical protein Tco_0624404 [Tanacetum coccineum]|uniref:Uncharacterized protein n=1 Tax=Tanacetum coccineum TaxID=301880 RepID=A0ABQ4WDY4_9ASTR